MSPRTNTMARIVLQRDEVAEIAGVGELVEIDDRLVARARSQSRMKLAPMKPAPPVTRIMLCSG